MQDSVDIDPVLEPVAAVWAERFRYAYHLAEDLQSEIFAWTKAHEPRQQVSHNEANTVYTIVVTSDDAPLVEWGLRLGTILHHLRSSLNVLVISIMKAENDEYVASNRHQFPVVFEPSKWEKEGRARISHVPEDVIDWIKRVQPMHLVPDERDKLALSYLNRVSNDDKHNVTLTTEVSPNHIDVRSNYAVNHEAEPLMTIELEPGGMTVTVELQEAEPDMDMTWLGVDVVIQVEDSMPEKWNAVAVLEFIPADIGRIGMGIITAWERGRLTRAE